MQPQPTTHHRLRLSVWRECMPLLDINDEISKIICSTNESLNARYAPRRQFATEQAALKGLSGDQV